MNGKEQEMDTFIYQTRIYFIFESNYSNYWMGALDIFTGLEVRPSRWIFSRSHENINKAPYFIIINNSWIFAAIPNSRDILSKDLVIFDTYQFGLYKMIQSLEDTVGITGTFLCKFTYYLNNCFIEYILHYKN